MTYCITGDYVLDGDEIFDRLSAEVKSLIGGLLEVDPYERLGFNQIINHPWLRSGSRNKTSISSLKEL